MLSSSLHLSRIGMYFLLASIRLQTAGFAAKCEALQSDLPQVYELESKPTGLGRVTHHFYRKALDIGGLVQDRTNSTCNYGIRSARV